jgi:hypothetical protein
MDFENETDHNNDAEVTIPSKLDSLWLGLIVGIVAPAISFLMFYYSSFTKVDFNYFIQYSIRVGALINILTVSLIPNFIIFALFIWRNHYKSAKGIVIASATLTVLLVAAKFIIAFYLRG